MKTKTATIEVYHVWGTKNDGCADILYRGKVLKRINSYELPATEAHINGLLAVARTWAFSNGFTHTKQALVS